MASMPTGLRSRARSGLRAAGRALLWVCLALWLGAAGLLFARLGEIKAARLDDDPDFARRSAEAGSRGWRVVHVLSSDDSLNTALLAHWSRRAPLPGLPEQIIAAGPLAEDAALRRLLASGWSLASPAPGQPAPAEPLMRILAPDGATAWTGVYRAEDLRLSGDAIWEKLAVARILAGERLPAQVPAGCALPAAPRSESLVPGLGSSSAAP